LIGSSRSDFEGKLQRIGGSQIREKREKTYSWFSVRIERRVMGVGRRVWGKGLWEEWGLG